MKLLTKAAPPRRATRAAPNPRRVFRRFLRVLERLAPQETVRGSAPFSGAVTREKP
ncbi:MAG: hypothetical protein JWL62_2954 [Hyphomicrobiales bacterium]|nr:hypothetical protein [Hyphomicrobiales bacterium]